MRFGLPKLGHILSKRVNCLISLKIGRVIGYVAITSASPRIRWERIQRSPSCISSMVVYGRILSAREDVRIIELLNETEF